MNSRTNPAIPCYGSGLDFGSSCSEAQSSALHLKSSNCCTFSMGSIMLMCIYKTAKTGCVKIYFSTEMLWRQFLFFLFVILLPLLLWLLFSDQSDSCPPVMSKIANPYFTLGYRMMVKMETAASRVIRTAVSSGKPHTHWVENISGAYDEDWMRIKLRIIGFEISTAIAMNNLISCDIMPVVW